MNTVSSSSQPRVAPKVVSNEDLKSTYGTAKEMFSKSPIYLCAVVFFSVVVSMLLGKLGFFGGLLGFFVSPCLTLGSFYIFSQMLNGHQTQFSDIFIVFSNTQSDKAMRVVKYLFYNVGLFLVTIFTTGIFIAFVGFIFQIKMASAANFLTGGPNLPFMIVLTIATLAAFVYLACTFFALPLVWFKDLDAGDAMKASWEACLENVWPLTWWSLIGMGIMILGFITIVGWLMAIPICSVAGFLTYQKIFPD